jgi:mono/diheme cytochrome c family protein
MDCITCHNRTAHLVDSPQATMDELIGRDLVSVTIPDIKKKGVEVLSAAYAQEQAAMDGIAGLKDYYQQQRADFYAQNSGLIDSAILAMQEAYKRTNFPDQKVNWETHPNNLAHKDSPGCFRCHDGKHLTSDNQTIRLECNLCHSIPVVSSPDQFITNIEVSSGPEPESHQDSNWINLHRNQFDESCAACHSVEDPGGSSNQSFCSNSACHGSSWDYAGFDAPKVREILGLNVTPTPAPTPVAEEDDQGSQNTDQITYVKNIAPLLKKCAGCHAATAQAGVNLANYASIMQGGDNGPIVVPGDPDNSLLVKAQTGSKAHFMQLKPAELETVIEWITAGALEK